MLKSPRLTWHGPPKVHKLAGHPSVFFTLWVFSGRPELYIFSAHVETAEQALLLNTAMLTQPAPEHSYSGMPYMQLVLCPSVYV